MTGDKTKQILCILKWQALVVPVQDNNKMDVIVQSRGIVCKFGFSGKDYVEMLQLLCAVYERNLFLLLLFGPFSLVFLLPNATSRS